jgi:hypothetical protein
MLHLSMKTIIIESMSQHSLKNALSNTTYTTGNETSVDNIFTNQHVIDAGTYAASSSYHEPL